MTPTDFGITDHVRHWPEGSFSPFCDEDWKRMQSCGLCVERRQIGPTGVRIAGGVRILKTDGTHAVRYFVCADHATFVQGLGYSQ